MTRDPLEPIPASLESLLGPIVDVQTSASRDAQRALLAEIELQVTSKRLADLEQDYRVLLQAARKAQLYLGRHIEPGGISAAECIHGLLKTFDNPEINELTKRR